MDAHHHGHDSESQRRLRKDGPTSVRRPRRARGRDLLETLENRSLLTVLPTALTLTPTPVEGVAFSGTTVATFYSPFDPNATDFEAGTSINWGDGVTTTFGGADPISIVPLSGMTSSGFLFAVEGSRVTQPYGEATQGQQLPVTVTVHDSVDGSDTTVVSNTTVADAILNTTGLTQPPVNAIQGAALNKVAVATFNDPNTLATGTDFTATINWGDGTPQTTVSGTNYITQPGGVGSPFIVGGDHTYATPGSYTVTVAIKDIDGSAINATTTADVAASTVTPNLPGGSGVTINETAGQPFTSTVVGYFTDTDTNSPINSYSATINWGTGAPTAGTIVPLGVVSTPTGPVAQYAVEGSFTYPSALGSPFSIVIAVNKNAALATTIDSTANVSSATAMGTALPFTATVGQQYKGPVASFIDSNPGAVAGDFTATINWGDSTMSSGTVTSTGGSGFLVTGADPVSGDGHIYTAAGSFPFSVTVSENGSALFTAFSTATVTGSTLTATGLTVTEPIFPPVAATTPLATFTDSNPNAPTTQPAISQFYSATINWGDGIQTPGVVTFDSANGVYDVGGTHQYAAVGTYQVTVSISDTDGGSATAHSTLTITDTPLTPTAPELNVTGVEGKPFAAQIAIFNNANLLSTASNYSATINWGDGTTSAGTVQQIALPSGVTVTEFAVVGSHTYAEESPAGVPYQVTVLVRDAGVGGSQATLNATATIADAPLASQGSSIAGIEGTALPTDTAVATFVDQNQDAPLSDYSAVIFWGDGTAPTVGTIVATGVTPSGIAYSVEGSHLYTDKGLYQTTVVISDVGGSRTVAEGSALMADAPATASPINLATTVDQQFGGPVAFFFQDYGPPTGLQPGGNYTATIVWGDGTPPSLGLVVPVAGGYDVYGVHTYLLARTTSGSDMFPVTVSIHDNGGAVVTTTSTATVSDAVLTGQLDPATDTGLSNTDGITKDSQPRFYGTGEDDATIQLFAAPASGVGGYVLIGQTATDASGAWSIVSTALPDGKYTILIKEIDASGIPIAANTIMPNANQGPLVIDTVGPQVTSVSLNRFTGQVVVNYSDNLSGLDFSQIDNSANYAFTKLGARSTANQITSIDAASTAADPQSVAVLTLNGGRPLRGGIYTFTILSGDAATGVRDVAGNALDGEFYGTFPSGNNIPGGNFVAEIDTIHNVIKAPKSVIGNASPVATGTKPTSTVIPTVNPKNAAALGRLLRLEELAGLGATTAAKKAVAHDAALDALVAKRRG